jgi:endoglucanase
VARPRTIRLQLLACLCLLASCPHAPGPARAEPSRSDDRIAFWSRPRRGTNYFAGMMTDGWARAARRAGIEWVRLTTANWPREGQGTDHLLGSADAFRQIPPAHLAQLRRQLDLAQRHDLRVVLTMLSLPGARWKQHHGDKNDRRLWQQPRFREQAAQLWRQLVARVGRHPALVAVNILNEPRPHRPHQLNPFYREMLAAVRSAHPTLPVMVDVGTDAAPGTIGTLEPLRDPNVLYGVHVYEPWELVTWRVHKGALGYPGADKHGRAIDAAFLRRTLQPVAEWQRRHGVPARRVVVAELGIDRRVRGAARYLRDVICLAEEQGWHWAFYAFRDWQGYDYELGPAPLPPGYWAAAERGDPPPLRRGPNPLWDMVRRGLDGGLRGEPCRPAVTESALRCGTFAR